MNSVCVINVVGLTPKLLRHAPTLHALAGSPDESELVDGTSQFMPWTSPLPAVTCSCQATMLTGKAPSEHGIVGNGWYYKDTQEVRFWQQARSLIQGDTFYDSLETA